MYVDRLSQLGVHAGIYCKPGCLLRKLASLALSLFFFSGVIVLTSVANFCTIV